MQYAAGAQATAQAAHHRCTSTRARRRTVAGHAALQSLVRAALLRVLHAALERGQVVRHVLEHHALQQRLKQAQHRRAARDLHLHCVFEVRHRPQRQHVGHLVLRRRRGRASSCHLHRPQQPPPSCTSNAPCSPCQAAHQQEQGHSCTVTACATALHSPSAGRPWTQESTASDCYQSRTRSCR